MGAESFAINEPEPVVEQPEAANDAIAPPASTETPEVPTTAGVEQLTVTREDDGSAAVLASATFHDVPGNAPVEIPAEVVVPTPMEVPKIIEQAPEQKSETKVDITLEAGPTSVDFDVERGKVEQAEAELNKTIETIPENERKEFGLHIYNAGYQVERGKSKLIAWAYDKVGSRFDRGGMMGRFFGAMKDQFTEKATMAEKQMADIAAARKAGETEGLMKQIGNAGYLSGNLLKYGRVAADVLGWTAGASTRYVTMGAMAAGSIAEGAKEARLANEEVKDRTRISGENLSVEELTRAWGEYTAQHQGDPKALEDTLENRQKAAQDFAIGKAADEANAIYETALKNKGEDPEGEHGGLTADELKNAYQEKLPADLIKRIAENANEGDAMSLAQKVFTWHIEKAANRMQKKLDAIDAQEGLDDKAKAAQKETIVGRFGRSKMLADFDRMLSQQGAVDTLAMSARYAEKGAKGVVYGMMADSVYRLWGHLSESLSGKSWDDLANLMPVANAAELRGTEAETAGMLGAMGETAATESVPTGAPLANYEYQMSASAVAAGAEAPNTLVSAPERAVVSGDTLWKISGGNPRVMNLSPEELRSIGIASGDPNMIRVGEKINVGRLEELLRHKEELGVELRRVAPHAIVERAGGGGSAVADASPTQSAIPAAETAATTAGALEAKVPDEAAVSENARIKLEQQYEQEAKGDLQQRAAIEAGRTGTAAATVEAAQAPSRPTAEPPPAAPKSQEFIPSGKGFRIEGKEIIPDRTLSSLQSGELARWPEHVAKPWPVSTSEAERAYGNSLDSNRQLAERIKFKIGRYPNYDEMKLMGAVEGKIPQQYQDALLNVMKTEPQPAKEVNEALKQWAAKQAEAASVAQRPAGVFPFGQPQVQQHPFQTAPQYPQGGMFPQQPQGYPQQPQMPFGAPRPLTPYEQEIRGAQERRVAGMILGDKNANANYQREMIQAQRNQEGRIAWERQVAAQQAEFQRRQQAAQMAQSIVGGLFGRRV